MSMLMFSCTTGKRLASYSSKEAEKTPNEAGEKANEELSNVTTKQQPKHSFQDMLSPAYDGPKSIHIMQVFVRDIFNDSYSMCMPAFPDCDLQQLIHCRQGTGQ